MGTNGGGGLVSVCREEKGLFPPPLPGPSPSRLLHGGGGGAFFLWFYPGPLFTRGLGGGEGCLFVRAERKGEERRGRWKDRECMEQVEEE